MYLRYISLFLMFIFLGCDKDSEVLTSKLLDSAVSGVNYKCVGYEGVTNSLGEFNYDESCGEITFYVGSVILDSIKPSQIQSDKKLYISELVGLDRNETSHKKVTQILQFLQSIDENNDSSDGIKVTAQKRALLRSTIVNFKEENLTQSQLISLVRVTGDSLITEQDAIAHFRETLNREENLTLESNESIENSNDTVGHENNRSQTASTSIREGNTTITQQLDNEVPKFTMKSSFSVFENQLLITEVNATDESLPIHYSIVEGNQSHFFTLNPDSGRLSFKNYMDYDKGLRTFSVKISVKDRYNNKAEKLLNIQLLDIDDTPFAIEPTLKNKEYFGSQKLSFSSHIDSEKFYYHLGDGVFERFEESLSLQAGKDYNISYYAEDSEGNRGEIKNQFYRLWVVVDSNGTGDYTSLFDAVSKKENRIWVKNGLHTDPRTIEIKYSDVIIKGESRDGAIIQKSGEASLILVVRTNHVTVENLTLDANTYDTDENEIWEAFGVFESHNVTLRGCKILGANPNEPNSYVTNHDDKYAVYFAGPYEDPGQAIIDRYELGVMDENNTMENNLIISYIRADATSFSMQRYGKMVNNHHIGSLISFFMNRDSNYSNNLLEDSVSVGIYVSLPAHDNIIENNVVRNARAAGIRVEKQSDHRDVNNNSLPLEPYRSGRNIIRNNKIYDTRYMGIEVGGLKDSTISGNYIEHTDFNGIHLNRVDDINVTNNVIVQGGQSSNRTPINSFAPAPAGIFVDQQTMNARLESNRIENNDSTGFEFGIRVSAWETISGTQILNNRIIGNFNQGAISNSKVDTIISGNSFE